MRGARVRNGVTDWRGKQILKANTMKALLGWGGGVLHTSCTLLLDSPLGPPLM